MQVKFTKKQNGPASLVADAEIVFEMQDQANTRPGVSIAEGSLMCPLAGMKLVGFSLWKASDGDIYVTFPSRAFGANTERKYFDYLRAVEFKKDAKGEDPTVNRVKAWILAEYLATKDPTECPS